MQNARSPNKQDQDRDPDRCRDRNNVAGWIRENDATNVQMICIQSWACRSRLWQSQWPGRGSRGNSGSHELATRVAFGSVSRKTLFIAHEAGHQSCRQN